MTFTRLLYNNWLTKKFSKIIVRLDDFHQVRDVKGWDRTFELLDNLGVRGVIAPIPKKEGEELSDEAARELKEFIRRGWEVAQHGYTHEKMTNCRGIAGTREWSEFAGLPYTEQRQRIIEGKKILKERGIDAKTFVPPVHSFDNTTVEVLNDLDFKVLNDGRFFFPRKVGKILMVPTHKIWHEFIRFGVVTLVLHPNEATNENLNRWQDWIEGMENCVMTCNDVYRWWSNSVEDFYDLYHERYFQERMELSNSIKSALDLIIKEVDFTERDRMIDIGCCPANTSSEIAKLHKEVFYLDLSENMLKLAKRNMGDDNKRYIKGDITNPEKDLFNCGRFDTATIFGLASVIDKDDLKKALKNTGKLLSEDGVLLMTYPRKTIHRLYYTKIKQNFIGKFKPVVRNYSYSDGEIHQLVKSLGFSNSCIHKLPGENSLLIAKK